MAEPAVLKPVINTFKRIKRASSDEKIQSSPPSKNSIAKASQSSVSKEENTKVPEVHTTPTKSQWWKTSTKDGAQKEVKKDTPKKKKAANKASVNTKQPKLEQLFLDFGQKNFDARICEECGMMYAPGIPEDVKMHAKLHLNKVEKLVAFKNWRDCKVVKEYPNEEAVVVISKDDNISSAIHKKVTKIRQIMDKELGFVDNITSSNSVPVDQKTYLYINSKSEVVGCIVAERIEKAYKVIVNTSESKSTASGVKVSNNEHKKDSKSEQKCGTSVTDSEYSSTPPLETTKAASETVDLDDIFGEDTPPTTPKKSADKATRSNNGTPKNRKRSRDESMDEKPKKEDSGKQFSLSCSNEEQEAVCGISRVSLVVISRGWSLLPVRGIFIFDFSRYGLKSNIGGKV